MFVYFLAVVCRYGVSEATAVLCGLEDLMTEYTGMSVLTVEPGQERSSKWEAEVVCDASHWQSVVLDEAHHRHIHA